MWSSYSSAKVILALIWLITLPARVFGDDILESTGFDNCIDNSTIAVTKLVLSFDKNTNLVTFDVAGSSDEAQKVSASLAVYAYGKEVYSRNFDPCDNDTLVSEICPVPAGNFSASGSYTIPGAYASLIPAIAYQVPNLNGQAKLTLTSLTSGAEVACVDTSVSNGKTASVPAAKYAAVGVAGAAFVVSGVAAVAGLGSVSSISAVGVGGHTGAGAQASPSFSETVGWLQTMAMNGMLSVSYPSIYRSFTQNFGFSTGLVSWNALQTTIDNFRKSTGGNLTDDSVEYLSQSTTIYKNDLSVRRRALVEVRDIITSVNGTQSTVAGTTSTSNVSNSTTTTSKPLNFVYGIKGYVEELSIPQSNTFMTVLLMFSVLIAAITAGILLFKVFLELWALFASFPKRLTSFRKQYWWLLAKSITNLIFLLYGVWTLYCIYQFTSGDSWAAKVLAGITLSLFTAVLLGFTFKIWAKAHQADGTVATLYEDKETWRKYSLFYENYKKSYWWLFVPTIVYMFARSAIIALADGHGLIQAAGQLGIDALMLGLLIWTRPYSRRSGNWINIIIQVVRVLSICCILVFVEELGFSQTTTTVTGLVLVIVQAVMTSLLAILIAINAIISCVRQNPHRLRRKEAEKLRNDKDELTPLDARNSMLMYPLDVKYQHPTVNVVSIHTRGRSKNGYDMLKSGNGDDDNNTNNSPADDYAARRHLPRLAATIGGRVVPARDYSQESFAPDYMYRQPQLPDLEYKGRGV